MYIKEIKVKNYRAFANEVNLNLKPNINKIEEDVETNNFKKIDDTEYFCPLASIGSANAKGKTSLLYTITDFFIFLYLIDWKSWINDEQKQKIEIILSQVGITDKKLKEKIINKYLEMFSSLNFSSLNEKFSLDASFKDDILNIINASKFYDEETAFVITNAFIKLCNQGIVFSIKNIFNSWKLNKNNLKENTSISITFFDEENKSNITITIFDENKDGIETIKYSIDSNNKNLDKDTIVNEAINYGKKITILTTNSMFSDTPGNELWMAANVSQNIIQMYGLVSKLYNLKSHEDITKKLVQIINIADSNIKNISFHDSSKIEVGILGFIFDQGNLVSPNHISLGTLKFIYTFNLFAKAIINHSQLILFDEIDAYLHISLVEFFKTWIRQSNYNIQLFFTSHNYEALTKNLSHKQIFWIDDDEEGTKKIVKVSSVLNKNNSAIKSLMEQKIGSHPTQSEIDERVWELIDRTNCINKK